MFKRKNNSKKIKFAKYNCSLAMDGWMDELID